MLWDMSVMFPAKKKTEESYMCWMYTHWSERKTTNSSDILW